MANMYGIEDEEDNLESSAIAPPAEEDPVTTDSLPQGNPDDVLKKYFLRQQELAAAEALASRKRFTADLGDAFHTLSQAAAPRPVDNTASYGAQLKAANSPLEQLGRRQTLEDKRDKMVSDYMAQKYKLGEASNKRNEDLDFRERNLEQRAKDSESRLKLAEAALGVRQDESKARREDKKIEEQKKTQEKEESLSVPGFTRAPGIKQTPEEASKARNAVGTLESVEKSLDRMQDLVNQYGSFEYGGKGGAEMETLATTLQIQLKNLYELGALSGPDMAILARQIKTPASLDAMFTRDSTAGASLEATKKNLRQTVMSQLAAKGYSPKPKGPETKTAAGRHNPGSLVSVRGKVYRVLDDGDSLEEVKNASSK